MYKFYIYIIPPSQEMRATAEEVARLRAAVEKLANETAADRAAKVRFPNCG